MTVLSSLNKEKDLFMHLFLETISKEVEGYKNFECF